MKMDQRKLASASLQLALSVIFCTALSCEALLCFENSSTDNSIVELVNDTSYKYCAAAPKRPLDFESPADLFGISPISDRTQVYDPIFAENNKQYQVLTICLVEKYNFEAIGLEELTFRCLCNYDKCNAAQDMKSYLKGIYVDNTTD